MSTTPYRFQWEKAFRRALVGKGSSGAATLAVGYTFASFADIDGSSIFPGGVRVADELGLSRSTVTRALTRLRDEGWLTLVSEGQYLAGRADEYRLSIPAEPVPYASPVLHSEPVPYASPVLHSEAADEAPMRHPCTPYASPVHALCVTGAATPDQGQDQLPTQLLEDPWTIAEAEPVGPPGPRAESTGDDGHWYEDAPAASSGGERDDWYEEPSRSGEGQLGRFEAKHLARAPRVEEPEPKRYRIAYGNR